MQTLAPKQTITATVSVERITSFWRYNQWSHQRELTYTISMREVDSDPDDPWYVTFTTSRFVDAINEGDTVTVEGKFKRYQEYGGKQQIVITHCKKL